MHYWGNYRSSIFLDLDIHHILDLFALDNDLETVSSIRVNWAMVKLQKYWYCKEGRNRGGIQSSVYPNVNIILIVPIYLLFQPQTRLYNHCQPKEVFLLDQSFLHICNVLGIIVLLDIPLFFHYSQKVNELSILFSDNAYFRNVSESLLIKNEEITTSSFSVTNSENYGVR